MKADKVSVDDPERHRRFTLRRNAQPAVIDDRLKLLHEAVGMDGWTYRDFFDQPIHRSWDKCIPDIESYVGSINWRSLPFLRWARIHKEALRLWTSQELLITNAFSQVVLTAAGAIKNVHLRTVLCTVAQGEHGLVDAEGHAVDAHPWLLHLLRESMETSVRTIVPLEATSSFVKAMVESVASPITALAVIGVGNERLLIPEYQEIESCFREVWPTAYFSRFLQANLKEDQIHYRLCYDAASRLIAIEGGSTRRRFIDAAIASVDSRVEYLKKLSDHFEAELAKEQLKIADSG